MPAGYFKRTSHEVTVKHFMDVTFEYVSNVWKYNRRGYSGRQSPDVKWIFHVQSVSVLGYHLQLQAVILPNERFS